jgi:photosystem II stability/assembly factor-like uncharacterized protein
LFVTLLLAGFNSLFAQVDEVKWLHPKPTPLRHDARWFFNTKTGFMAGEKGSLFKTTNGGQDWEKQALGTLADFHLIYFFDNTHGWLIGRLNQDELVQFRTTDGGSTWSDEHLTMPDSLTMATSLCFQNRNVGWLGGGNRIYPNIYDRLYKTTNGGQTWQRVNMFLRNSTYSILFRDSLNGFVISGNKLFKSTDGGISWGATYFTMSDYFYADAIGDFNFHSPTNGFLTMVRYTGHHGATTSFISKLMRTTDAGVTWTQVTDRWGTISYCRFSDDSNGVAFRPDINQLNLGFHVMKTTNGGRNWVDVMFLDNMDRTHYFPNDTILVSNAVGSLITMIRHQPFANNNLAGTLNNVHDVFILDSLRAWAGGVNGYDFGHTSLDNIVGIGQMIKTTNGGQSWERCWSAEGYEMFFKQVYSLHFTDKMHGWFCLSAELVKTTNAGQDWISMRPFHVEPDNHIRYRSVASLDSNRVWAFGSHIIKSVDGGANWTRTSNVPNRLYWHGQVFNENDIVAISDSHFLASTNGGTTWSVKPVPLNYNYWRKYAHFYNPQNGCIIEFLKVACTTNGGNSWHQTDLSSIWESYPKNVLFINENEVLISSSSGIYKSIDAGTNWHYFPFSSSFQCSNIALAPNGKLYISGENGGIGILENNFTITQTFNPIEPKSLVAVFPNPAQHTIQLGDESEQVLSAYVINAKGKLTTANLEGLNKLDIKHLAPGLYQAIWQTSKGWQSARFTKW